jgi:dihydrofolate reductase
MAGGTLVTLDWDQLAQPVNDRAGDRVRAQSSGGHRGHHRARTMEQLESQLPAADAVLMAWLADYLGPNPTADQVLAQIGALLIGNRTYQLAKTEEGKPYGGAWAGPMFVLTHEAPEHAAAGFTFVSGDINQAVATAKAAAGDKYVVVFGATTTQECLDAGLLDDVLVHIAPVLLRGGFTTWVWCGMIPRHGDLIDDPDHGRAARP